MTFTLPLTYKNLLKFVTSLLEQPDDLVIYFRDNDNGTVTFSTEPFDA